MGQVSILEDIQTALENLANLAGSQVNIVSDHQINAQRKRIEKERLRIQEITQELARVTLLLQEKASQNDIFKALRVQRRYFDLDRLNQEHQRLTRQVSERKKKLQELQADLDTIDSLHSENQKLLTYAALLYEQRKILLEVIEGHKIKDVRSTRVSSSISDGGKKEDELFKVSKTLKKLVRAEFSSELKTLKKEIGLLHIENVRLTEVCRNQAEKISALKLALKSN